MIVTRMAPSPTGLFHVGGLRTALYDYLLAKQDPSGIFFLRIEDTDRQRLHTGAIADVIHSFAWTHISPDQGVVDVQDTIPVQKGEYGPYIQSERLDIYNTYIDQLIAAGQAYYAFDTAEELETMRQRQTLNKEAHGMIGIP